LNEDTNESNIALLAQIRQSIHILFTLASLHLISAIYLYALDIVGSEFDNESAHSITAVAAPLRIAEPLETSFLYAQLKIGRNTFEQGENIDLRSYS
jgi:hypothetical protein